MSWAVILLLVGVVALGVAVRMLLAWRGRPRTPDGAACGRCGYSVRGLPTFTCPECGSDLREVGIITPQTAPGRSGCAVVTVLGIVALVGLLLFVLLAAVRRPVAGPVAPRQIMVTPTSPVGP